MIDDARIRPQMAPVTSPAPPRTPQPEKKTDRVTVPIPRRIRPCERSFPSTHFVLLFSPNSLYHPEKQIQSSPIDPRRNRRWRRTYWSASSCHAGHSCTLPPKWISIPLQLGNYPKLFEVLPFDLFLTNSIKIAVLATVGSLLSCSMAAFAFARMRFPGSNAIFAIILATMMIPFHVTLIPLFKLYRDIGWFGTHFPLTVPFFFGTAFGIFLMRQFYLTIPQELVEAARIDGCSFIQIYYRIFLPLSKPALAALGIFTFLDSWNNLMGPLIFLTKVETMTITWG